MTSFVRAALPEGRVRLITDLARLKENYRTLSALLAATGTEPIAVLKANAYGHGALPIAAALAAEGARRFAVSSVEEGLALRAALPGPEILVLGYTPPAAVPFAAEGRLTLSVHTLAYAEELSRCLRGKPLSVHIKLNSGMNRTGLPLTPERFDGSMEAVLRMHALPGLCPTGIYSHLAAADEEESPITDRQLARFSSAISALARLGIRLPSHLAASAAVLSGRVRGLPLARLGLALYGYPPTGGDAGLLPIARLVADLAQVYTLPAGETVGYGGHYVTHRRETVGILPIGYADGLPRAAEGGTVRVAGRLCPLIGRISMDAAAVLLSGVPLRGVGSATVFGEQPGDLFALAAAAHTIPYELLAGLGARIDRKYQYGTTDRTCDPE